MTFWGPQGFLGDYWGSPGWSWVAFGGLWGGLLGVPQQVWVAFRGL